MRLLSRPSGPIQGRARPPGDKSISHRALILGALAQGTTEIEGLLEGEDVLATAAAMRAFGAEVAQLGPGRWRVTGRGGFAAPAGVIDCGNSGTGVRLIMGAAAGFTFDSTFTGDASLRKRPMNRVLDPLRQMGLKAETAEGGRLPATLHGGALKGIAYRSPMASAQVKSALLLAGLRAEGAMSVEETPTRDHTERMLRWYGVDVRAEDLGETRRIALPEARALTAPGDVLTVMPDPSSAAFAIVAALITPGSVLEVPEYSLNPTRAGLLEALRLMGADIEGGETREIGGEPVQDLVVRHSKLRGVAIPEALVPAMIDEFPILAVAAAFAEGETVVSGAEELRVKESDRIALSVAGLRLCGVDAEERPDGMIVRGGAVKGGAAVVTHGDHRIAMSFLVLGGAAQGAVQVDEAEMIATSFPGFGDFMRGLGAEIVEG
jgi:3-phosphoshikimate 1-carboxyvinyltransferase